MKGQDPQAARIAVFNQIRDIPYYLVPQIADPYEWAQSVLKENKGSCSPKHYLLGLLFSKLGIPIKYATYPFQWDKQAIKYPPGIMDLARGSPVGYHGACKAYLNDKWVLVDATWDIGLKKSGFPVNDRWDGISQTLNAVTPIEEIVHDDLQDRLNYVAQKKKLWTPEQKSTYAEFIEKFNLWLEELRKQGF